MKEGRKELDDDRGGGRKLSSAIWDLMYSW